MDWQKVVVAVLAHFIVASIVVKSAGVDTSPTVSNMWILLAVSLAFTNVSILSQKWDLIDWPCQLKNTGLYMLMVVLGLTLYEMVFGGYMYADSWVAMGLKAVFVVVPGLLWYIFRDKIYYDACSVYERQRIDL